MSNASNAIPNFLPYFNRQAGCGHCAGVARHEAWCVTLNPVVSYAYQIVDDPGKVTLGDCLILHSLGVSWSWNRQR